MVEPRSPDRRPEPAEPGSDSEFSWWEAATLAPALLRTGLLAGQRLATWTVSSTVLVTRSATQTVGEVRTPADVLAGARDSVLGALREALGVAALEAEVERLTGHPGPDDRSGAPRMLEPVPEQEPREDETDDTDDPGAIAHPEPERLDLRDRGRELLAQSATLEADEEHPAFGLVLEQLAPDEMRILRVLVREGDQATVDVETGGVLGGRGPVVARRVSLLAETAGCKHPDRLAIYLDNLVRLGVVRVGDDPLDDGAYEVIEVQPRVDEARQEASKGASRARLTRRRLELSDFGAAFARSCLPD